MFEKSTQHLHTVVLSRTIDEATTTGFVKATPPAPSLRPLSQNSPPDRALGIELEQKPGGSVVIRRIIPGTAASGLVEVGDIISEINGEDVTGWPLAKVVDKLKSTNVDQLEMGVRSEFAYESLCRVRFSGGKKQWSDPDDDYLGDQNDNPGPAYRLDQDASTRHNDQFLRPNNYNPPSRSFPSRCKKKWEIFIFLRLCCCCRSYADYETGDVGRLSDSYADRERDRDYRNYAPYSAYEDRNRSSEYFGGDRERRYNDDRVDPINDHHSPQRYTKQDRISSDRLALGGTSNPARRSFDVYEDRGSAVPPRERFDRDRSLPIPAYPDDRPYYPASHYRDPISSSIVPSSRDSSDALRSRYDPYSARGRYGSIGEAPIEDSTNFRDSYRGPPGRMSLTGPVDLDIARELPQQLRSFSDISRSKASQNSEGGRGSLLV